MTAFRLATYSLRSLQARWSYALIAMLGIAGAVSVIVCMLALQRGFSAALALSGSAENAMVRRAGSITETDSALDLEQARIVGSAPGIAASGGIPLVSPEAVAVAPFKLRSTTEKVLVQVRGVTIRALEVHHQVKIVRGRFFDEGLAEMVVGKSILDRLDGCELGREYNFGGRQWRIVGVMDSGGSAFDSEVWTDLAVFNQAFRRSSGMLQSIVVRLRSPALLPEFKRALAADPRLQVLVEDEIGYYNRQSRVVSQQVSVLGAIVAGILTAGAFFGALNIAYSSVAARLREIAILRAIGFGGVAIVFSFLFEMLLISLLGGLVGCAIALPINGHATSTINWQTLSDITFAFQVTPGLLIKGMLFALSMGLIGGFPPAMRAARLPVASGLRGL